jgi:hypothetical protein
VQESREQKIRDRAHRLWEAEGRPEGRGHEHWLEAERQVLAEEAAGAPSGPLADPLHNPELIPPGQDPIRPAVAGPEIPSSPSPQPEIPTRPAAPDIPPEIPNPPATPDAPQPTPPPAPVAAAKRKTTTGRGKGRGGTTARP